MPQYPDTGHRISANALVVMLLIAVATLTLAHPASAEKDGPAGFQSHFTTTPDRVWPGANYWPNPMENWRIQNGRLECTHTGQDRNVHLLTHHVGNGDGGFTIRVQTGLRHAGGQHKQNYQLAPGDALTDDNNKPRIQNRALTIIAKANAWGDNGVILAQGGGVVGFSLYLSDGKPAFAVRNDGELKKIVAKQRLDANAGTVQVRLETTGKATLRVDGKAIAEGQVGLVGKLPIDGLQVGRDAGTQVGPYDGPSPFNGQLGNVQLKLGKKQIDRSGAAGFTLGVASKIDDYRADAFASGGLNAAVTAEGKLRLANQSQPLNTNVDPVEGVDLILTAKSNGDGTYKLILRAEQPNTASPFRSSGLTLDNVDADRLEGAVRLAHNPGQYAKGDNATWWFKDWQVTGDKIEHHPTRAFGPILWSMYTLSDSRSERGHVLNLTAQMPPLGAEDSNIVTLQIKRNNQWHNIETTKIDPDARNALFKIDHWAADDDVPYRLVYETKRTDGETVRDTWTGTIRKEPVGKESVSIADLSCQVSYAFPYEPVAENVAAADPDMLFFAGDQLYEPNGGYGIVRRPADKAIVSYLRKYYMHGWAFRHVMRNRPTVCIPDDHDVFHGNLWGEGGAKMDKPFSSSSKGGYIEPVRTINAIYRTQTSHLPGVESLEPAKRGVRVMYSDLVYGGLSLAVLADRQFKSSPREVDTGSGRADILKDADIDPETLDKPGLKLLGKRQLNFLRDWVEDWRGAQMKVLLSQTTLSNAMTHTGPRKERVIADLDSNGWPQTARDQALRILRKGFVFHLAGDQHLPTLVQHGIETQRDGIWTFCGPGIAVGWQRWFEPDSLDIRYDNRPHDLANTGEYTDGFGNLMYVRAVGNPPVKHGAPSEAPGAYKKAHRKASGFGIARFDKDKRTITTEAYTFFAGLRHGKAGQQFPGWPVTVKQISGKRAQLSLLKQNEPGQPELEASMDDIDRPVVKVYDQKTGKLVYAIRAKDSTVKPFAYEGGPFRVKIGDPATNTWRTYEDLILAW